MQLKNTCNNNSSVSPLWLGCLHSLFPWVRQNFLWQYSSTGHSTDSSPQLCSCEVLYYSMFLYDWLAKLPNILSMLDIMNVTSNTVAQTAPFTSVDRNSHKDIHIHAHSSFCVYSCIAGVYIQFNQWVTVYQILLIGHRSIQSCRRHSHPKAIQWSQT